MDEFRLVGKSALITGGARGIGLAIANAFADSGARVALGDIDGNEAREAAQQLSDDGLDAIGLDLDVTDTESIQGAVSTVLDRFGGIDILVNNAGINTVRNRVTIEEYSEKDWRRILSVDLDGVFLMSRPVVSYMKASGGGGRIINIASVLGMVPARLQSGYVAAKAAVINLTKSMAIELAPNKILVNCIAPGSTLTRGTEALFYGQDAAQQDRAQSLLSHIPMGRPGQPEEIALAAVFLASPAASYITGVVLPVDGGWTAGYIRDW